MLILYILNKNDCNLLFCQSHNFNEGIDMKSVHGGKVCSLDCHHDGREFKHWLLPSPVSSGAAN